MSTLIGQELGPFRIDKELGSGAMGTVYLGTYVKRNLPVAVKVMLPGMDSSEQSVRRFKRESAILKQFDHPNIVKILAIGKHEGVRYYAMELIHGESLDTVLERKGRFGWEEVVDLGCQLCGALQHAHTKGVIHRDLKPSNLMVLGDGTLKLTDFGIAKDLDVTQLTSANCTVGTASYMSPEQCQGVQNLTHKSDLYSLGIVLYELLTGRKPFNADNVMDMFMAHVKGKFTRPMKIVPDVPKWLDVLVCQLLEKPPEQRPVDANKVGETLAEVREKMEHQRSFGQDVAEKRQGDLRKEDRPLTDEEKEAARSIRAGKKRRRRKSKGPEKTPFYRAGWFILVAATVAIAMMVTAAYVVFFKPPSADSLYDEAKVVMTQRPLDTKRLGFQLSENGAISLYLRHYGGKGDDDEARQKQVRQWREEARLVITEENLMKWEHTNRTKQIKVETHSEAEKLALRASAKAFEGKLDDAAADWQEIVKNHNNAAVREYVSVAEKQLQEIEKAQTARNKIDNVIELALQNETLAAYLDAASLDKNLQNSFEQDEPKLFIDAKTRKEVFEALRYDRFGDVVEAYRRMAKLKERLKDDREKRWSWAFLLATARVEALHVRVEAERKKQDDEAKWRAEFVNDRLEKAKKTADSKQRNAKLTELISLYKDDKAFEKQVREAESLLKKE